MLEVLLGNLNSGVLQIQVTLGQHFLKFKYLEGKNREGKNKKPISLEMGFLRL